jgi:hypothetical protein
MQGSGDYAKARAEFPATAQAIATEHDEVVCLVELEQPLLETRPVFAHTA